MMRKVIGQQEPKDVRLAEDVSDVHYYGAELDGQRGFILRTTWGGAGPYHVLASRGLTMHNHFDAMAGVTLRECVENLLADGNQVYEFDTPEELFKWLAGLGGQRGAS